MLCTKKLSKKSVQDRFWTRILAEYCANQPSTIEQQVYMSVESLTNFTCTGIIFVQLEESVRKFVQLLANLETIVSTSNWEIRTRLDGCTALILSQDRLDSARIHEIRSR